MLLTLMGIVFTLSSANGAETPTCPEGGTVTEGEEAQFVQRVGKWTVMICGRKTNSFNRDIFSDFNLYYFLEGKKPIPVPFEAGAAIDYAVKKISSGLIFSEVVLIDNEWLPLFDRQMKCSTAGCKIGRKYCANTKLSKKPDIKQVHALIGTYRRDAERKVSTGQATDPAELDLVLAAAIAGDSQAIQAFDKNPGFRLDGAATEHYEHAKRTLKHLKSMKCKL